MQYAEVVFGLCLSNKKKKNKTNPDVANIIKGIMPWFFLCVKIVYQ